MSRSSDEEPPREQMERSQAALKLVSSAQDAEPMPMGLDDAFRRYSRYVAAISLRLLGRDDEVDDLVQDVFLSALKGMAQLRDPLAIKGWLATVTVRQAKRKLQVRRIRSVLGLGDEPAYENIASSQATPETRAVVSQMYRCLDGLPVDERIAWVLRNIEGEQLEDVAQMCGCSLATAKRRISAAQQAIERALSDERSS